MSKKLRLSEMKDRHVGLPAAVLGGGPSLVDDLKRVPANAILIAVNYHGLHYCDPMYMVYNDAPETNPLQVQAVRAHRTIHVSPAPEPSSDVIFDVPAWTGFFSSHTATWLALWMGCDPVILCGHDLYQGPVKHVAPSNYDHELFHRPLDFYMRPWQEEGLHMLPGVERVRAMSGPLVSLFGAYESSGVQV